MLSWINSNPELFSTLITFLLTAIMLCGKWSINAIMLSLSKSKFIKNLKIYVQPLVTQAEQMMKELTKAGTTKKEWVLTMMKAKATALHLEKVWSALEPIISELIDQVVAELNQFVKASEANESITKS